MTTVYLDKNGKVLRTDPGTLPKTPATAVAVETKPVAATKPATPATAVPPASTGTKPVPSES